MKIIFSSLVLVCVFLSCEIERPLDLDEERKAIMKLHNSQRDYHFMKDSIAFANQLSNAFVSVNKGMITTPQANETINRYHNYFSSVNFVKWDDVSDPIIRFSDDGTLAYTIVDKIVEVNYDDKNGVQQSSSTHFAWTAIYKKYGSEWKIDCVTSTQRVSE